MAKGIPVTRIEQEIVECFACGEAFKRTAVLDVDPNDTRVLGDDRIVRAASAIRCPHCGYEEIRSLRVRKGVRGL